MIGKVRQDSAKFSNWRPKATEPGRIVSCVVRDGRDCPSQAGATCLRTVSGAGGQIVEFTPSWPRRYYLALKADAGSVPCSSTIHQKPNPYRLGFFCPFPQCWRGFQTWPREHHTSKPCVFIPTDSSLFSVFFVGHASVLEVKPPRISDPVRSRGWGNCFARNSTGGMRPRDSCCQWWL